MQKTIDETARRRMIQLKYNEEHHIVPKQIKKSIKESLAATTNETSNIKQDIQTTNTTKLKPKAYEPYIEDDSTRMVADPIVVRMSKQQLEKSIEATTQMMKEAAKNLDFLQAAQYRDEIIRLQQLLEQK